MAPSQTFTPLSPAELTYLSHSLHLNPPIRPDARSPTQFRPLHAETDILPTCNGSCRMVWADGAECVAGIKAEVTRTEDIYGSLTEVSDVDFETTTREGESGGTGKAQVNRRSWVEIGVDVQGLRDDDALNVFLAGVVAEGLFAGSDPNDEQDFGGLTSRLKINDRYHWKLYIDILLITPPPTSPSLSTTHPLTLLSLTTHLALRTTHLPRPVSEGNEDPVFNDDWDQAIPLYPAPTPGMPVILPPISILVMTVGPTTVLLDPSRDELAVADAVWAISLLPCPETEKGKRKVKIVGIRTLESMSVPVEDKTVGYPPGGPECGVVGGRGGVKRDVLRRVVKVVGACAGEVWDALDGLLKLERETVR